MLQRFRVIFRTLLSQRIGQVIVRFRKLFVELEGFVKLLFGLGKLFGQQQLYTLVV